MRLWGMNVILPFKSGNWLDSHFTLITMQMRQRCDNFFDIPFDRKKCEVTPKSWTSYTLSRNRKSSVLYRTLSI